MDGKWFGLRDNPNLARSEFAKGATGDVYKNVPNTPRTQIASQNNQTIIDQPQNSE